MRSLYILAAIVMAVVSTSAQARRHHHHSYQHHQARIALQSTSPEQDHFLMPMKSDVADYSATPSKPLRRIARIERVEHRRIILSLPPVERPARRQEERHEALGGFTSSRPGDCYGIAWCGCFMRHYFGIANRALNLARNWAGVGSRTTPHSGAIVVWRHHVGVLRSEPDAHGRALVLSGNNGSGNRATVRPAYIRNAIAFRQL